MIDCIIIERWCQKEDEVKEYVTTITQRGQITIPVEVQRLLGVKPHDRIALTIEDGIVELRPVAYTVETAFASVPPLAEAITIDEQIERAKEERAERLVRKLRQ